MMQRGIPLNMVQGIQGMPGLQTLQGMQGLQGLQGIQGINPIIIPQGANLGMFGNNPQVGFINGNNPNGQGAFIGMNQIQGLNGANGIPLNVIMAQNALQQQQNAQQQQNDKNKSI